MVGHNKGQGIRTQGGMLLETNMILADADIHKQTNNPSLVCLIHPINILHKS